MRYFAGIDGGATKTVCAIGDAEGRCLGRGTAGPSNHHNVGLETALSAVSESVAAASREADLTSKLSVACAGLAALDTPADERALSRGFARTTPARKHIAVHDSLAALTGAFAGGPGIVAIAGTGSVVAALDPQGRHLRVGGWGYIIGDEGSAYDMARRGLAAAMRAYDGRAGETRLLQKFMRRLKVRAPEGIIDALYADGFSVSRLASLAPLVAEAAREGDNVAEDVLRTAGEELGEMVAVAATRSGMKKFKLATLGGAFNAGHTLLAAMESRLSEGPLSAVRVEPRFPPHYGALMIAMRAGGVEFTHSVLENLESSAEKQ